MIKRKQVWLAILIILLGVTSFLCIMYESSRFGGINIISKEELQKISQGREYIKTPQNADDIISFNGNRIPYDKNTNTFYVSHNASSNDFSGNFAVKYTNFKLYFESDDLFMNIKDSVKNGHRFNVWLISEDSYTICGMIITGMPVVAINTDENLSS